MYSLPELPYAYDALQPVISQDIMRLHHQKHHQSYVDKLNAALEQEATLKDKSLVELMKEVDSLPESVRVQVRNHGGGHYNHSLFWTVMCPGGRAMSNEFRNRLSDKYGSFEAFMEQFNDKATKLFGSGWVWLTSDLETVAMPNQDNPLMQGGNEPVLGLDVWEHAYYLDYTNKRDEYIQNWWKVVDWQAVEDKLTK